MARLIRFAGMLAVLGALAFWLLTAPAVLATIKGSTLPLASGAPDPANGKAMFYAGGCASCHATENQPDKTLLGGGHALKSPFGTFYAPNISSHPRDGIGAWTPEHAEVLRAAAVGRLGPDTAIEIRVVERIERTVSGKLRLVVREGGA